ncbi:MAG: hypothetical protein LBE13_23410, partial [Bacteroidales bacterium]|nr:hypothetical protein [Bacteroidales bacterium]
GTAARRQEPPELWRLADQKYRLYILCCLYKKGRQHPEKTGRAASRLPDQPLWTWAHGGTRQDAGRRPPIVRRMAASSTAFDWYT